LELRINDSEAVPPDWLLSWFGEVVVDGSGLNRMDLSGLRVGQLCIGGGRRTQLCTGGGRVGGRGTLLCISGGRVGRGRAKLLNFRRLRVGGGRAQLVTVFARRLRIKLIIRRLSTGRRFERVDYCSDRGGHFRLLLGVGGSGLG